MSLVSLGSGNECTRSVSATIVAEMYVAFLAIFSPVLTFAKYVSGASGSFIFEVNASKTLAISTAKC
jgi:hypothetical protein